MVFESSDNGVLLSLFVAVSVRHISVYSLQDKYVIEDGAEIPSEV